MKSVHGIRASRPLKECPKPLAPDLLCNIRVTDAIDIDDRRCPQGGALGGGFRSKEYIYIVRRVLQGPGLHLQVCCVECCFHHSISDMAWWNALGGVNPHRQCSDYHSRLYFFELNSEIAGDT